jgi:hypothetical protein
MGITYRVYLDNQHHPQQQYNSRVYACSKCKNHLSTNNLLVSKVYYHFDILYAVEHTEKQVSDYYA